jgi:hypothetical protein
MPKPFGSPGTHVPMPELQAEQPTPVPGLVYLARESGLRWFHRLNLATIDPGSGKRVIVKNGVLDKEFGITVPGNTEGELF